MFADGVRYEAMGTWGSYVSTHRYNECPVFADIERKVGVACKYRQVGNIVNDLRMRGENEWIELIELDIQGYNEEVKRHNQWVADENGAVAQLKRIKGVTNARQLARLYMESEAYEQGLSARDWLAYDFRMSS